MSNKKIALAAGHYLGTPGKRTPDGVKEWTLNNAVCNYITEYLKDYNVEVIRVDDVTGKTAIILAERVKATNKIKPDLFMEIHHNGLKGKWGNHTGTEVYSHTNGSEEDKKVAKLLAPKISKETGLKNRGAKTASFEVLTCKANIPAVLCEGGFMDSKIDNPIITSEKGQRAYAKAVSDGIIEYLELKKSEDTKGEEVVTTEKQEVTAPDTASNEKPKEEIKNDSTEIRQEEKGNIFISIIKAIINFVVAIFTEKSK